VLEGGGGILELLVLLLLHERQQEVAAARARGRWAIGGGRLAEAAGKLAVHLQHGALHQLLVCRLVLALALILVLLLLKMLLLLLLLDEMLAKAERSAQLVSGR